MTHEIREAVAKFCKYLGLNILYRIRTALFPISKSSSIFFLFFVSSIVASQPIIIVVFGATGDLTAKKILPAIDHLTLGNYLPEKFAVVGVARKSEIEFRKTLHFNQPLYYVQVNFDDDGGYQDLKHSLDMIDIQFKEKSNRIYFLATQPSYFATIVEKLATNGLIYPLDCDLWSRVMIEKPFGHDLQSAIDLRTNILSHLDESQVYLIDHFLGKEGVSHLVEFRQRGDYEDVWNKNYIERIEFTIGETIGIGTRAKFWEETGLLRDVVQNHMMQLVSLVAMERSNSDKLMLLNSIRTLDLKSVVRRQYGPSNEDKMVGYKDEAGVPSNSNIETLFASTLFIDNGRWRGVDFHIRAAKRVAKQVTEIVVFFKNNDELCIRIQPDPSIFFKDFPSFLFDKPKFPEAYQKLIYDCINQDRSSFVENDEQIAAWRLFTPILEHWKTENDIEIYPAGTDIESASSTSLKT